MIHTKILGTGSYAPSNVVTNDDLTKIVDTSDEWIYSRTGIKKRHITQDEYTIDLAEKAAKKAIKDAQIDVNNIDLVIVATVTPDNAFPGVSNLLQKRLGLDEIMTFDINAACSGFIYALNIADKMIKSGSYKNALIVGAETLTRLTDWSDRNTCVLFGDGAGAFVISKSNENKIKDVITGSVSDDEGHLICQSPALKDPAKNVISKQDHIHMNGREVFKFATRIMPSTVEKLLKRNNMKKAAIDHVIAHQANARIIQKAAKTLNIPMDKMYLNIQKYGNTSAASVPLAIDQAIKEGVLKRGETFITVAFGGGFTYGGALIEF
ncbi:MAG: ketoacyl-ACP synthase III [Candidatus Izimaplasma sp.]|nr:ketoacyl-ACP synthase III [Candidatus Izimaplasma bacterium]